MTITQFALAYSRHPYVRTKVYRWILRNRPPAAWRGSALEWAYTEMPVIPLTRLWWRFRRVTEESGGDGSEQDPRPGPVVSGPPAVRPEGHGPGDDRMEGGDMPGWIV